MAEPKLITNPIFSVDVDDEIFKETMKLLYTDHWRSLIEYDPWKDMLYLIMEEKNDCE